MAKRAQEKRLSLNLSQKTLSQRSGVSYGTLKKFERTGKISLESLLKIAFVLDAWVPLQTLFSVEDKPPSLDALLEKRKRGRQ